MKTHDCYKCIFRGGVPGSAHSSCHNTWTIPELNSHGVENGWVAYPIDFDPIWVDKCDAFIEKGSPQEESGKKLNDMILDVFKIDKNSYFDTFKILMKKREIIEVIMLLKEQSEKE